MRVKAKLKKGVVEVKMMAKHEMSTYDQAEKKTGDKENANFITHIDGSVKGTKVIDLSTSQFLSKNPILKFKFKLPEGAAKGDKFEVTWTDRKGKSATKKAKIK
jgi:sulfur-oxidizing protein SoxZ